MKKDKWTFMMVIPVGPTYLKMDVMTAQEEEVL
jgi:hypothetical protein